MSVQPAESMREVWASWQGQVLHGTFPLHRCLGSTDHSGVFLTELTLRRAAQVAIKVVPAIARIADSQLQQWTAAALLDHPHLVRILETGRCQFDGAPYLYVVMEYADQNLAELLPRRALTEPEAREMLVPALDALAFLHNRNLVQGQLKPANLLAVGDQLKLASDTIHPVGATTNVGTVYDPPEARDGSCSTASDVWALGVTLFEALTQHVPEILDERRGGLVFPPEFPPAFREMVAACLSRRPYDRPKLAELDSWVRRGGEGWRVAAGEGSQPETGVQASGGTAREEEDGRGAAGGGGTPSGEEDGRGAAGRGRTPPGKEDELALGGGLPSPPDLEIPDLAAAEVVAPAGGPIELEDIATEVPDEVLNVADADSPVADPATFELAEAPLPDVPAIALEDAVVTHPDAFALVDTPAVGRAEPNASASWVAQEPRPVSPEAVVSRGPSVASDSGATRALKAPDATVPNASVLHLSQATRSFTPGAAEPRQPRTSEPAASNATSSHLTQATRPVAPMGLPPSAPQSSQPVVPNAPTARVSQAPGAVASDVSAPRAPQRSEPLASNAPASGVSQAPHAGVTQASRSRAPGAGLTANASVSRLAQVPQRLVPQTNIPRALASELAAPNASAPRRSHAPQPVPQAPQQVPQAPQSGTPQGHRRVGPPPLPPRMVALDSQAAVPRKAQTPEPVVSRARVGETTVPRKPHEAVIVAEFAAPPPETHADVDEEVGSDEVPARRGAFLTFALSAIVVVALALVGVRMFMAHRDAMGGPSQGLRGATVPDTSELTESADAVAAAPTASPVHEGAVASASEAPSSRTAQIERPPAQAIPTSTLTPPHAERVSSPVSLASAPAAAIPTTTIEQSGVHPEFPDVPQRARRGIRGHVRVSVRVIVDKEGTVFAALVDDPGPSKYFEQLALDAAKKWTFPAVGAQNAEERRWELVRFDFTRDGTTGRADPVQ